MLVDKLHETQEFLAKGPRPELASRAAALAEALGDWAQTQLISNPSLGTTRLATDLLTRALIDAGLGVADAARLEPLLALVAALGGLVDEPTPEPEDLLADALDDWIGAQWAAHHWGEPVGA
jgi:hypothetical protein